MDTFELLALLVLAINTSATTTWMIVRYPGASFSFGWFLAALMWLGVSNAAVIVTLVN